MKRQAANVCIYCGDIKPPLSKEHIVPLGLGGNLVIHRASCKACAKETGWIEQICLRTMFGLYRARTGIKTRNPKKRRSTHPLKFIDQNMNHTVIPLPLHEHPAILVIPRFDAPNILSGKPPPDPDAPFILRMSVLASGEELAWTESQAARAKAAGIHIGSIDVAAFARMLAKIAHAYVYTESNGFEGGFRPLLKDTILGKFRSFHHFVGEFTDADSQPETAVLHRMSWHTLRRHSKEYYVADIRLFANNSTPTYRIVVAER